MAEVKTRLVGIDERTFLRDMAAEHFAQRLVHQMRGRVITDRVAADLGIDVRTDGVTNAERALVQAAMMAEHVRLHFQRISDVEYGRACFEHADVASLAARFRIKRRRIKHHDRGLASANAIDRRAFDIQRDHFGLLRQGVIADEFRFLAVVLDTGGHLEFTGGARLRLLPLHRGFKAGFIELDLAFAANIGRQVERKTKRVIQRERRVAIELAGIFRECDFQDFHAIF